MLLSPVIIASCFIFQVRISGDPLLLWDGPPHPDNRDFAWTYYLKGAARATMALFAAVICLKLGHWAFHFFGCEFCIYENPQLATLTF